MDAEALVVSQTTYQVELLGPTAKDYRWQAREQIGYALTNFSIDWEHEQARCPQGQISSSWTPTWTRNQESIKIKFGFATCGGCPVRSKCTKAKRRSLSVRRQEAHFALDTARQREKTEEFKQEYAEPGRRRRRPCPGDPSDGLATFSLQWRASYPPYSTPLSHFAHFMKEAA